MRNVKVAVVLTALALAGCTGAPPPSSPPPGGSSPAPGTSTTSPTTLSALPTGSPVQPPAQTSAAPLAGGPTEVPSAQIDGGTLPDIYKRRAWHSADGLTLQVVGVAGGCKTASAEVTAQSADQVQVTLVTTYYPPPAGAACTQELRDVPLNVTLAAPLGARRVVLEAREQTA